MVTVLPTLTEEERARREELLSRPEYRDLYPWRNQKTSSDGPPTANGEGKENSKDLDGNTNDRPLP